MSDFTIPVSVAVEAQELVKGTRTCAQCCRCTEQPIGWSEYTIDGSEFCCMANPAKQWQDWEDARNYAAKCDLFFEGNPIALDFDGNYCNDY